MPCAVGTIACGVGTRGMDGVVCGRLSVLVGNCGLVAAGIKARGIWIDAACGMVTVGVLACGVFMG